MTLISWSPVADNLSLEEGLIQIDQQMKDLTVKLQPVLSQFSLQGWIHNLVFSATDQNTVAWASGSITFPDGSSFSIDSGNTGNISAVTYIYLDLSVSTTVLQTSTTVGSASGVDKLLVSVADNVSDSAKKAEFIVYGGGGDVGVSKSILVGVITAGTITGNEVNTMNLTSKTITADTGTIGGWTLSSAQFSAGSVTINASTERILMGAASAPGTGVGIFMGKDGSDYEFRAGDPAGDQIFWNGSTLVITGAITAVSGTIGGWTISPSELSSGSVKIQSTAERFLLGLATAPLTGVGIFIGKDSSDYEFRAGDPAGDFIHWTGSALNITGVITATSGTIGGWTLSSSELSAGSVKIQAGAERILMGSATAPLTGTGVFIGKDGSDYEFRAGNPAGNFFHWDGTNITIGGTITGSSLIITGATQFTGNIDLVANLLLQGNATQEIDILANLNGTAQLILNDLGDVDAVIMKWDGTGADAYTLTVRGNLVYTVTEGSANITFAGAIIGDLTGDVTGNTSGTSGSTTGNAATATALATARLIGGTSFDGTANIAVNLAATATALETARNINGVPFNGTGDITITAAAGTLTGNTLASGVTASSLTSLGTLGGLNILQTGTIIATLTNSHASNPVGILIDYSADNPGGTGNLFINCTDSSAGASQMTVSGDGALLNETGGYGTISDLRLKTEITPARPQLPDIRKLGELAVNYELMHKRNPKELLGWIAQEVEEFMPGLVGIGHDGYRFMRTSVASIKTVIALGELANEVDFLKGEVASLKQQMAA